MLQKERQKLPFLGILSKNFAENLLSFYSKICEEKVKKLEVANLVSFGMLYVRQFSLD